MNPSKSLVTALRKNSLLPADSLEIDGYYQLETMILRHIASLPALPTCAIWFDGECIESKGAYVGLLNEFIKAADCQSEVEILQCEVDFDSETAICRASRNGSLVEASWAQQSDWVASEFFEFTATLLNSDKGQFVDLATGDQTYLSVFLPPSVLKSFNRLKTQDTKSRDGFFSQHGEGARQHYGKIRILPLDKYRSVLRSFKSSFIKDGPICAIDSYREGRAIEVAYVAKSRDALAVHRLIAHHTPAADLYADLSMFEYENVCPDEYCYFLSFDAAYDQVVFSIEAKLLPTIVGAFERVVGEHLLVGHNMNWAVYVKEHSVICIGDVSMTLAASLAKRVHGNETAEFFDRLIEGHFGPTLNKLGYEFDEGRDPRYCTRDNGEVRAVFYLDGRQKEAQEPLEISISVSVFCPAIESMLRDEDVTAKWRYYGVKKYPKESTVNRWAIGSKDDYGLVANEMCRFIEDNAVWASEARINQELLAIYEQNEQLFHAAAVAVRMQQENQAVELVKRGLDRAQKIGLHAYKESAAMAAALGLL